MEILETIEIDLFKVSFSSNGMAFLCLSLDVIDLESNDHTFQIEQFSRFFSEISPQMTVRIYKNSWSEHGLPHNRAELTEDLAYFDSSILLVIEKKLSLPFLGHFKKEFSEELAKDFVSSIPFGILEYANLLIESINLENTGLLHFFRNPTSQRGPILDQVDSVGGILNLTKLSSHPLRFDEFYQISSFLPQGSLICLRINRMTDSKAERFLRIKSNRALIGSDRLHASKYLDYQKNLEEVAMNDEKLIEFEFSVILQAQSDTELRALLEKTKNILKPIGEIYIETFGAKRVFSSLAPGGSKHHFLIEKASHIPFYLPIAGLETPRLTQKNRAENSLPIHRLNETLHYIDLFNPLYESYSVNIIGRPGTGKSVLTNLITQNLACDPDVRIILIDVGGSHSKNTENLGGEEFTLSTSIPSGLNPFSLIDPTEVNSDSIRILAEFVLSLIKEEDELFIRKDIRAEIEESLTRYFNKRPIKPSLEDFYNSSKNLPRRDLLSRWVGSGVYGQCFQSTQIEPNHLPKLSYFNFKEIDQAIDQDFSQGGLGGILATFNLMVQKKKSNERFVFIADEVPVFIKRSFSFFELSISNIRKKGDAFITIAQRSEHLCPGGNTSIIDNSPTQFLFSQDGSEETFKDRMRLTNLDLKKIENLNRIPGQFSECFIRDSLGKRTLRIRLSQLEHWLFTSKKEDQLKIESLLREVPGLTRQEAISCLAIS